MDLKQTAISLAMMTFVLSSMIGMGLGLRVKEIVAPLRNWRLVAQGLLANFVVMPLVAIVLAKVLRLDQSLYIGLLLLGAAGGAPFLPKLALIAKGNLAFAVGLMVLLMVITAGYLPVAMPMFLPGVSVSPGADCPATRAPDVAAAQWSAGRERQVAEPRGQNQARSRQDLEPQPNGLIGLLTLLSLRSVMAVFGTGGIFAGVAFLAVGYAVGWVLGGPAADTRQVLGLGTSQRNIAAALVVANQSFDDPDVVVMVVVVAIVGLLTLMPLARALGRRGAGLNETQT